MFENSPFELIEIDSIVEPKETGDPRRSPETSFRYIDIASVSNESFSITNDRELLGKDAPSRARKIVRCNDIIFATTRPYLKSVALVRHSLDGQYCSTGFCVLRPTQRVLPNLLFFFSISH